MKHTPGPWRVSVEKYPEPRKVKVGTGEDGWWGVASTFGDTQEEAEANARLIAAAPDMLEALELVMETYCLHIEFTRETEQMRKARTLAGYAIDKATKG